MNSLAEIRPNVRVCRGYFCSMSADYLAALGRENHRKCVVRKRFHSVGTVHGKVGFAQSERSSFTVFWSSKGDSTWHSVFAGKIR